MAAQIKVGQPVVGGVGFSQWPFEHHSDGGKAAVDDAGVSRQVQLLAYRRRGSVGDQVQIRPSWQLSALPSVPEHIRATRVSLVQPRQTAAVKSVRSRVKELSAPVDQPLRFAVISDRRGHELLQPVMMTSIRSDIGCIDLRRPSPAVTT